MKKQNIFLIATMVFVLLSASLFSQVVLEPTYEIAKINISGDDYFDYAPGETMVVTFNHVGGFVFVDDSPGYQAPEWHVFNSPSTASINNVTASGRAYEDGAVYRLVVDEIEYDDDDGYTKIYAHWTLNNIFKPGPDPID